MDTFKDRLRGCTREGARTGAVPSLALPTAQSGFNATSVSGQLNPRVHFKNCGTTRTTRNTWLGKERGTWLGKGCGTMVNLHLCVPLDRVAGVGAGVGAWCRKAFACAPASICGQKKGGGLHVTPPLVRENDT